MPPLLEKSNNNSRFWQIWRNVKARISVDYFDYRKHFLVVREKADAVAAEIVTGLGGALPDYVVNDQ